MDSNSVADVLLYYIWQRSERKDRNISITWKENRTEVLESCNIYHTQSKRGRSVVVMSTSKIQAILLKNKKKIQQIWQKRCIYRMWVMLATL